jgi:hypothetical protein
MVSPVAAVQERWPDNMRQARPRVNGVLARGTAGALGLGEAAAGRLDDGVGPYPYASEAIVG